MHDISYHIVFWLVLGTVRNNPPLSYMYNSQVPYMLLTKKRCTELFDIINRCQKNVGKCKFCKVGGNSFRFSQLVILFQCVDLIISYS